MYSSHAASWNNEVLATALCVSQKVAASHDLLPECITIFIAYMTSVAKVADVAKYAK